MREGRRRRGGGEMSRAVLVLATLMTCIGCVCGICVMDNKKGWHIQCGVRDSYLFRLKDYGGVNANFDFSFGLGDEVGFPLSIKNTKGHHHYRRKDSTARNINEAERRDGKGGVLVGGRGGKGSRSRLSSVLIPPPPNYVSERSSSGHPSPQTTVTNTPENYKSSAPSSGDKPVPLSANSDAFVGIPYVVPQARRRASRRRSSATSSLSSFFSSLVSWLPWPFGESSWFSTGSSDAPSRADPRNSHFRVIHEPLNNDISFPHHQSFPQSFPPQHQSFSHHQPFHQPFTPFGRPPSFGPPPPFGHPPFGIPPLPFPFGQPPRPPQSNPPRTVGPDVADVLQVSPDTPADTDHVPSFAAKVFVVREAPKDFYPPGYTPDKDQRQPPTVEVPRTKFFCEEQRYLPGLYADTQLGCKVFHMCLPAAVGNTQTSFLCPNMTLFDQSILSCNWWYYVRCEDSAKSYDANLPLALSYRKVNAAQLPLAAINDYNSLSLLDVSARKSRQLSGEDGVNRMGLADDGNEEENGKGEEDSKLDGTDGFSASEDGEAINDDGKDGKIDGIDGYKANEDVEVVVDVGKDGEVGGIDVSTANEDGKLILGGSKDVKSDGIDGLSANEDIIVGAEAEKSGKVDGVESISESEDGKLILDIKDTVKEDENNPISSQKDNVGDVKTNVRKLDVSKTQEEEEEGKDERNGDTEATTNMRSEDTQEKDEGEDNIATDTGQSRKKRRKRSNLDSILYLPSRHDSVLLSRLQRRKNVLP